MAALANPYQRIMRAGEVLQPGHIDTQKKFAQLVDGIGLRGKRILDVGCNLGEMCRLAKEAGAAEVRGIDIEPAFVYEARRLFNGAIFEVRKAERATGNWDIVLASAMLHYCDLDKTLAQFARVARVVSCDVWIESAIQVPGGWPALLADDKRPLWVPNESGFRQIASGHFGKIERKGRAESPDGSERWIYHLSEPKPRAAKAVLLFGAGGTGKTSRARDLKNGLGFEHLELDAVFLEWRIVKEPSADLSVCGFVDEIWKSGGHRLQEYLDYHRGYIFRWLGARVNLDVVIDGYDMIKPEYRQMVRSVLVEHGWTNPEERECKAA